MSRIHHKCHFCGGNVSEQNVIVDYCWGEELLSVIRMFLLGCVESVEKSILKPKL